jgi:hypothetical protein
MLPASSMQVQVQVSEQHSTAPPSSTHHPRPATLTANLCGHVAGRAPMM